MASEHFRRRGSTPTANNSGIDLLDQEVSRWVVLSLGPAVGPGPFPNNKTKMSCSPQASSRTNPCPICGRTKDGDCRIGTETLFCHYGSTFSPPDDLKRGQVIDGWAYTGDTKDGRTAHFVLDKQRNGRSGQSIKQTHWKATEASPARFDKEAVELARLSEPTDAPPQHIPDGQRIRYSESQWIIHRGKGFFAHYLNEDGDDQTGAGPDPWPLYKQEAAIEHGKGLWVIEMEGEKCVLWAMAAGHIAVSQPGHNHTPIDITRRYTELKKAGIAGIVYISDNDTTGQRKAETCSYSAATAGLPFIHLPATQLWGDDIPQGGSIDDAEGTADERLASIQAALDYVVSQQAVDAFEIEAQLHDQIDQAEQQEIELTYTQHVDHIIDLTRKRSINDLMVARADLKKAFRLPEHAVDAACFKRLHSHYVKEPEQIDDFTDMESTEAINYAQDGWVIGADLNLFYAAKGVGKTTLALWLAHNRLNGSGALDRPGSCKPSCELFLATDSGKGPLKRTMTELGIENSLTTTCRFNVKASDPKNGQSAWSGSLADVLWLMDMVQKYNITDVTIDSAKSVMSKADLSYENNQTVSAWLTFIKEVICDLLGVNVTILTHNGSMEGAHSGAKAWAEIPSMVVSLEANMDDGPQARTVTAKFIKDRIGGYREVTYFQASLEQGGGLHTVQKVEQVSSVEEAISEALWQGLSEGKDRLQSKSIIDRVLTLTTYQAATVRSALSRNRLGQWLKVGHGTYRLKDHEIRRREVQASKTISPEGYISNQYISSDRLQYKGSSDVAKTLQDNIATKPATSLQHSTTSLQHCQSDCTAMDLSETIDSQ